MNMISALRQRVREGGAATITIDEFNQLQAEWITRVGADEVVAAEREECAALCDAIQSRKGEQFFGQLVSDGSARQCAAAIRAR